MANKTHFAFRFAVVVLFFSASARAADPAPIEGFSDHGFLVEEAYNQDLKEVQHTLNAAHISDSRRLRPSSALSFLQGTAMEVPATALSDMSGVSRAARRSLRVSPCTPTSG